MDKKKKQILLAAVCLLVLSAVGFVSYRLGKGPKEKEKEDEGTGASFFSEDSAVLALSEGGARCDYSVTPAPYALIGLADRLVGEIEKEEGVFAAAFYMRREGSQVYYGMESLSGGVYGVGSGFLEAAGLTLAKGRGITKEDIASGARAAVVSDRAAARLFGSREPLGQTLEIEGLLFQVVGVAGTGGAGEEAFVLVPESLWPELYQYEEPKAVTVWAEGGVREAAKRAERILTSMIPGEIAARYTVQGG